jgi:2-oxoglutarate ferredoxin oxidoreductase subunit alpha
MILGDGLIGQMMEPVEFPEHLAAPPSNKDEWATNGMDTRNSETTNLVKSLYLDPTALNNHNLLLKAKYDRMKVEDVRYEAYHTDGAYQALIVSYGTMSRVCRTAIDNLAAEGIDVGMIRPKTLFPFPEKEVRAAAAAERCRVVLSIEMSMGQMVEDVERCVMGKRPVRWYGKCGGEVPTPEEIMEVVKEQL